MYQEPVRRIKVPPNQLKLTETEQKEEIARVLTANDPNVPNNIAKYNFKEKVYKKDPPATGDHLARHFTHGRSLCTRQQGGGSSGRLRRRSARRPSRRRKDAAAAAAEAGEEDLRAAPRRREEPVQLQRARRADLQQPHEGPGRGDGAPARGDPVGDLRLLHGGLHARAGRAGGPGRGQGQEEGRRRRGARGEGGRGGRRHGALAEDGQRAQDPRAHGQPERRGRDLPGLQVLGGRLGPVPARRGVAAAALALQHRPHQAQAGDGAGVEPAVPGPVRGRVRQLRLPPAGGARSASSLKNTGAPEYLFATESGALPGLPPAARPLLAVGCSDGTVMVYGRGRNKGNKPIYSSSIKTGKHTDPVWQVHWQEEDLAKELNFYSVSSDGRVANWIMSKNELKMEPVMQLRLVAAARDDPEEAALSGLAGGCCFDFNRAAEHLFVVGTEEGKVHKCSKAYSGQYLETYEGHHMAVHALRWNPFHERVFLSCSADWTVKLWDHNLKYPVMSRPGQRGGRRGPGARARPRCLRPDLLGTARCVCDLARTSRGSLRAEGGEAAAGLAARFNDRDPILTVGDDRGGVNALKLSPNLRRTHAPPEEERGEGWDPRAFQREKLEKLLQV
ncbi:unnamed protein product, partial [Heterosigma akashiwo]